MWITFDTHWKTALNGLTTSLWFSREPDKILDGWMLDTPWKPQRVLASTSMPLACMQLLPLDLVFKFQFTRFRRIHCSKFACLILNISTVTAGYIPSFTNASPTHLLVMTATIRGTIYINPPVNSNMITTKETARKKSNEILQKNQQRRVQSNNNCNILLLYCFKIWQSVLSFFYVRSERIWWCIIVSLDVRSKRIQWHTKVISQGWWFSFFSSSPWLSMASLCKENLSFDHPLEFMKFHRQDTTLFRAADVHFVFWS